MPEIVNKGVCVIDGCGKKASKNGKYYKKHCGMHLSRFYTTGSFDLKPRLTTIEMINKYSKKTETGCEEYTRGLTNGGYGKVSFYIDGDKKQKTWVVHRFVWEHYNGPIPEGLLVLHKCDNPPCRNIDHLFLGTHNDNCLDRMSKGRSAIGSKNGNSVLNEDDVMDIYNSNEENEELAKKYKVHKNTISNIKCGKNWSHLTGHINEKWRRDVKYG